MLNEIQVARYEQLLAKLFEIANGAPSPNLATEVFPTIPLEVGPPEFSYLRDERLMIGYDTQAGVAGEYSRLYIGNPLNSNVIVIVESVRGWIGTAGDWRIYGGAANVTPTGATRSTYLGPRDSRWNPAGTTFPSNIGSAYLAHDSDAGFPLSGWIGRHAGSANISYDMVRCPLIINPGRFFVLTAGAVNVSLTHTVYWRERVMSAGESR
jgi:hypothetical protein